jgi:hypothetical protein
LPVVVPGLTKRNILQGALIYAIGDSIAAVIISDFSLPRLMGILFLGGLVYAFEIPNYLSWLNKTFYENKFSTKFLSALLFSLYFNPIWIARHLLVLNLFKLNLHQINWSLLKIGWDSFVFSFFVALPVNYIIINKIPLRWKFPVTAVFSSMMAIFYALSEVMFK